jgi:hypothetical protein
MEAGRTLTLHFIDGTRMSFDFPEQSKGVAGKQLRLDSFRDSNHVLIEADGSLLMFPMANIKYLQWSLAGALPFDAARPPHDLIQGATISG